jgi:hypothetical protein
MWWTGAGILGIVFPAAAGFAGNFLGGPVGLSCGVLVGSVLTWYVGRMMNRDHDDPDVYDDEHTLYSIPMQYWAFISGFWAVFHFVHFVESELS